MQKKISTALLVFVGLLALTGVSLAETPAKVDLNHASEDQLTTLPGVGPALAARIVEFREKNGGFQRIEDLLNVRGIGDKKFSRLESMITVSPPAGQPASPATATETPSGA